jgi:hypothetical protein
MDVDRAASLDADVSAVATSSDPLGAASGLTTGDAPASPAIAEAPRMRDLVPDGKGGMVPRDDASQPLRSAYAQATDAGARPPLRDLVSDGNGGMVPRGSALDRGALLASSARRVALHDDTGPAAARGARLGRDLVSDGQGGMTLRSGSSPFGEGPAVHERGVYQARVPIISYAPRIWTQNVVDAVIVENGWAVQKGWSGRDGAVLCALNSGRLLLVGGWDTSPTKQPWPLEEWVKTSTIPASVYERAAGRALTTNEIWASDDGGQKWELLLPHIGFHIGDPFPPRFPRVHTPAWAYCRGYFYLIGGDVYFPHSQVWRTSLSGNGKTWQRVTTAIGGGWERRILSIAGSLNGKLYAMGGHLTESAATARNDVYEGIVDNDMAPPTATWTDAVTWTRIADAPWKRRGMVFGMPVIITDKKALPPKKELFLVGGARYHTEYFDDVWSFDGVNWTERRPNTDPRDDSVGWLTGVGAPLPATSGRGYHNVVYTPPTPDAPGGTIWVITGATAGTNSSKPLLTSRDWGETWRIELLADWGQGDGSHADAVTLYNDTDIIRASGNAWDRSTYRISQVNIHKLRQRRPPTVTGLSKNEPTAGDRFLVFGTNFSTVRAVYVWTGNVTNVYAEFRIASISETSLELRMPKVEWVNPEDPKVFIIVVNPDGSSAYPSGVIVYVEPPP